MNSVIRTTFLMVAALWLAGCAGRTGIKHSSPGAVAEPESQVFVNQDAVKDYRIGVDDIVNVSVWKNEDLSVQVPVRPDGKISVPLIGDVHVGGDTPAHVAEVIAGKLRKYLRDPKVTVILSDLRSHAFLSRVRVTGAVEKPVSLPYRPGMTVLDAVLEAGGVTKFAAADSTKLYRHKRDASGSDEGGTVLPVKLKRILKKGDLSTNYPLAPGDVITVPERFF